MQSANLLPQKNRWVRLPSHRRPLKSSIRPTFLLQPLAVRTRCWKRFCPITSYLASCQSLGASRSGTSAPPSPFSGAGRNRGPTHLGLTTCCACPFRRLVFLARIPNHHENPVSQYIKNWDEKERSSEVRRFSLITSEVTEIRGLERKAGYHVLSGRTCRYRPLDHSIDLTLKTYTSLIPICIILISTTGPSAVDNLLPKMHVNNVGLRGRAKRKH